MTRARWLEQLRLTRVLPPERLDAPTLAAEVGRLVDWRPAPFDLDLNGAAATAQAVADLDHRRQLPHQP